MKRILVFAGIFLFVLSMSVSAQTVKKGELTWYTKFEEAQKVAKAENKTIFALFTGSDWCPWCIKLDNEILSKKEFADYAKKNLVMVYIDFPRKTKLSEIDSKYNNQWRDKYPVKGYPTVVLMNSDLKLIETTGYQEGGPVKFVTDVKALLSKK